MNFFVYLHRNCFILKLNSMKRLSLAFIFACFAMVMAAQDAIRVNYRGASPTISDFVWAYLSSIDNDDEDAEVDESFNAVKSAWVNHRKGLPQSEGGKLTVDEKNGYVLYEFTYDENTLKVEMCYWNEADKKHKLFAYNVKSFNNGKYNPGQYDGLLFYRYNNATKEMTPCDDTGFETQFSTDDGAYVSYTLPRVGKDIIVTSWYDNGKKKQKTLKWKGRRFSY